ncbi:MAG: cellulase family glycosylhydrolase [Kiritimatiellaeota bacterium]|nr:cellulase family glycosylhydrolase [Kiritimatiellota bacterium]
MNSRLVPATILVLALTVGGGAAAPADRTTRIDANGVLRWRDDGTEVALFGVNYYPPFAIDYTRLKARGIDHRAAIRRDVAHFVRLGLSSIRLHCWDREISDRQGNLIDNEHLELLDYLIAESKKKGIYTMLTPIAWWPSWMGPKGFSNFWTMQQMTSDPKAWKAQATYLRQFVAHVNRYTGLAYKDDPAIIAFETINEPIYPKEFPDAKVVEYINTLVRAIRSTGCRKPVFHSYFTGRLKAVGASEADGVTFGWYPTGLVAGRMRTENCLPLVSDYPAMRDPALARKVKAVYEFDAADVQGPYMYPAIARAFRGGGCQIANQFQYDPLALAAWNPNWQTHYLNLCYTPNKALSFAIAAEVFRRIPRGKRFGGYPQNCRFDDFRVSYGEQLSELAAPDAFLYSNDTKTKPPLPGKLTRVWGCGSSPVVTYAGTGAYFLDKQAAGVWLLEVYPDAIMVADPYAGGTKEKVRILYSPHEMRLKLPDLGLRFRVQRIGVPGNVTESADGRIMVEPGRYMLSKRGKVRSPQLPPFIAPRASDATPAVGVDAPARWREGAPLPIRFSVAALGVRGCTLHFRSPGAAGYTEIPMDRIGAYEWRAEVPVQEVRPGTAAFYLSVAADRTYWFPGGRTVPPPEQDKPPIALMTLRKNTSLPPVRYAGPASDGARARIVSGRRQGEYALRIEADGFGPPPSCAAVRWPSRPPSADFEECNAVRFLVRGAPDTSAVEIGLVQEDGRAFGWNVPLTPTWNEVTVPLEKLRRLWSTTTRRLDPSRIAAISITFGAWLLGDAAARRHWVEVQSVALVPPVPRWEVKISGRDARVVLLDAAKRRFRVRGGACRRRLVPGMGPDSKAMRFSVAGFGPEPDCRSFKVSVAPAVRRVRSRLAGASSVVLTARAGTPRSRAVELVLIEDDGAPWGVNVPLTSTWRAIRVPLSDLRYYRHWNPPSKGRGGPGDRFHPEKVSRVSICFGAFLYPKTYAQPHAIEIQDIALSPGPGR